MEILGIEQLEIPAIKVIRFQRFGDFRGYFTETYRESDFREAPELNGLCDMEWVQHNESFSNSNTIRGLHFQWNPYMGKLVRTIQGRMVDIVLDIRKGSPHLGKVIMYDMPSDPSNDWGEWIWVPPGFAHGNFFPIETTIEYLCTSEYSPNCEAGISPLSEDLDWSLCKRELKELFDKVAGNPNRLITEKDENGLSLRSWLEDERSANFIFEKLNY